MRRRTQRVVHQGIRQLASRAMVVGTLAIVPTAGVGGFPLGTALADTPAASMPVALGGYQISTFATGTSADTKPDAIVADGGFIYVAYQNDSKADGSNGKASTIVQYGLDGKVVTSFSVTGHCDGLRVDPSTHVLWATVNEDASALLYTIDPRSGTVTPYTFSSAAHGGGYDDLAFVNGMALMAASNPALNSDGVSTGPAVVNVTLNSGTATVTPVLMGNATAFDTTTNKPVTLNLVDPDSMTVDPQGDVVLIDQAGGDIVFLHHAGTPQQVVTHVPAGTQLEDTVWSTADKGRLFVVDAATNAVYSISGNLPAGTVYSEAPNDSGVANWVGTIDLSSGVINPIAIGFGKATGLLYVPDAGVTPMTPAATAANSSPAPSGATPSGSSPAALQATQAGTLAGSTGGSFAQFQIANPTASAMTLRLSLGAFNAAQAHAIGINLYQNGAKLGSVTATSTGIGDATSTSAPTLRVNPSATGGPVLVQVFNYTTSPVDYTLEQS